MRHLPIIRVLFLCLLLSCGKKPADIIREKEDKHALPNSFAATVENGEKPPGVVPNGMIYIPGGTFSMGTAEACEGMCAMPGITTDALPIHPVFVNAFFIDRTEVTNAQFAEFVKATGYVTVAEQQPTREEFPDALPDMLVAGSVVFAPPDHAVSLDNYFAWWTYVKGANWRHPTGPGSDITGKENYPVVQVTWEDAAAYAAWAGKRLPTEAEWEFAARGGRAGEVYMWGETFQVNNQFMCNSFQGDFPQRDTAGDGYMNLAPVGMFPPNHYGLLDMSGNAWEWCSDWYDDRYYRTFDLKQVAHSPQGPANSHDSAEPGVKKKAQRGGSYLCTDQYCSRYMNGTRGKSDWRTATCHAGFRCVKDIR